MKPISQCWISQLYYFEIIEGAHGPLFFFIATLITDLKIEPDPPFLKDYCGTCTACIDLHL